MQPAVRKPAVRKPAVTKPAVAKNGLPAALAAALLRNKVVVVSLFAPNVELDDMAMREARAGASEAGVGFLAVNVLNERQSRPLTKQLGVLEDPAVLIFRSPSELVLRFSGFADKQTVFHVKFDVATGDDYFNKMVGHNVLINDLYALNGGGPR